MRALKIVIVVVILLGTLYSNVSAVRCAPGWFASPHSRSCIQISRDRIDWFKARQKCKSRGGDLVKIINSAMNALIYGRAQVGGDDIYWIGLHDFKREGTYQWLDERREARFTMWGNDQPDNYYSEDCGQMVVSRKGRWNDGQCNDERKYICEVKECRPGRYGIGCRDSCSSGCAGSGNECDPFDGTCKHGCDRGYRGQRCQLECQEGNYGKHCANKCSVHCSGPFNACDHVNGSCDKGCLPGYIPPLCSDECPQGMYGLGCVNTCSAHCAGPTNPCDHVDGSCDQGCDAGYSGSLCSDRCDKGKHGEGCTQTCSEYCAGEDNPCHHVNGTCDLGCSRGYRGALCTEEVEETEVNKGGITSGTIVAVVVAVAGVVAAVAVAIGVYVWRRWHGVSTQQTGEASVNYLDVLNSDKLGLENVYSVDFPKPQNPDVGQTA